MLKLVSDKSSVKGEVCGIQYCHPPNCSNIWRCRVLYDQLTEEERLAFSLCMSLLKMDYCPMRERLWKAMVRRIPVGRALGTVVSWSLRLKREYLQGEYNEFRSSADCFGCCSVTWKEKCWQIMNGRPRTESWDPRRKCTWSLKDIPVKLKKKLFVFCVFFLIFISLSHFTQFPNLPCVQPAKPNVCSQALFAGPQ